MTDTTVPTSTGGGVADQPASQPEGPVVAAEERSLKLVFHVTRRTFVLAAPMEIAHAAPSLTERPA